MTSTRPAGRATALAAAALATLALVVAGPVAASSHPRLGLYDCMTSAMYIGGFSGSVKLMSHGKYVYAQHRKGKRLLAQTKGRWGAHGQTISWKSGVLRRAGFYGVWNPPGTNHPKGFIALFSAKSHSPAGIACYPV